MKKTTVAEQLTILSEIYRQPVSAETANIWFGFWRDYPDRFLVKSVQAHIQNVDQGRFFPTPAHLLAALLPDSRAVRSEAAEDIRRDPTIDGTSTWDVRNEKAYDREQRIKRYIDERVSSWDQSSIEWRLNRAGALTDNEFKRIKNNTKQRELLTDG